MTKKQSERSRSAYLVLSTRGGQCNEKRRQCGRLHGNYPAAKLPFFDAAAGGEHDRAMAPNGQHTILVWDEAGKVSDALRRAAIGVPMWRGVGSPKKNDPQQVGPALGAPFSQAAPAGGSPPPPRTPPGSVGTTPGPTHTPRPPPPRA